MLKILRFFYYKIFVNNLFLFICKNVISIIIEFLILILCIYRLLINPFNKKIYVEKNLKKKIFLFKSGTMGDHLICINVLNYFGKYFKFSEIIIVCRKRNIFTQIKDYSRIFKIDLISYFDYIIDLFNFHNEKNIKLVIDTEPNFRIGIIFALISNNSFLITNKKNPIDNLIKYIFGKKILFNFFDENQQESEYIFNLINKSLNNCFEFFKEKKIIDFDKNKFISFFNKFENFQESNVIQFHDQVIRKNLAKKNIYLYYGCSGKAKHRLPPESWFMRFLELLDNDFKIFLVGSKSDYFKLNNLKDFKNINTNFIGKFTIIDWSNILSNSKYSLPLLSFDGGFAHIYGIHKPKIFQVFCSSNANKWKNKSFISSQYNLLNGGSKNYKPFKFLVPSFCPISLKAWNECEPEKVVQAFLKWYI